MKLKTTISATVVAAGMMAAPFALAQEDMPKLGTNVSPMELTASVQNLLQAAKKDDPAALQGAIAKWKAKGLPTAEVPNKQGKITPHAVVIGKPDKTGKTPVVLIPADGQAKKGVTSVHFQVSTIINNKPVNCAFSGAKFSSGSGYIGMGGNTNHYGSHSSNSGQNIGDAGAGGGNYSSHGGGMQASGSLNVNNQHSTHLSGEFQGSACKGVGMASAHYISGL